MKEFINGGFVLGAWVGTILSLLAGYDNSGSFVLAVVATGYWVRNQQLGALVSKVKEDEWVV